MTRYRLYSGVKASCILARNSFQMFLLPIGNPISRYNTDLMLTLTPMVKITIYIEAYLDNLVMNPTVGSEFT